jgi:hypothetical protein
MVNVLRTNMLSTLFLLATTISPTTLNSGHVPVSVKSIHDSVTARVCTRAYFSDDAPYIVLDNESTNDPTSIDLSIRGVNTLASILLTPIGIVVKSQAAVDALAKNEPVALSYVMPNRKDSVVISFPADTDLHCR